MDSMVERSMMHNNNSSSNNMLLTFPLSKLMPLNCYTEFSLIYTHCILISDAINRFLIKQLYKVEKLARFNCMEWEYILEKSSLKYNNGDFFPF
jgi:hypothetical protein